jgi:hypothetical protein
MGYCTFLSLGRYGRFANQIFQIAGTIGIARKNNLQPVFPAWINYDHKERFGSTEDIDLQKYFVNPLPTLDTVNTNLQVIAVQWGYHDIRLRSNRDYNLSGHMQSPKYFEHCIAEVRHYMTMVNELPRQPYIALHWRLGDYDDLYHTRLKLNYYEAAAKLFPGTRFMVFTDDREAVKSQLDNSNTFAGRWVFPGANDYITDFKILKACSGFIIGNSSYSAAAAILSDAPDKRVVAPKNWFGPSSGITAKDIYGENWIVL